VPIVSTQVLINAPIEKVWLYLSDIGGEWNPVLQVASGELASGNTMEMVLLGPAGIRISFKADLLDVQDSKIIRWMAYKGIGKIYRGDHSFELVGVDGGSTKLVQIEKSSGIAACIGMILFGFWTKRSFRKIDNSLKRAVELSSV